LFGSELGTFACAHGVGVALLLALGKESNGLLLVILFTYRLKGGGHHGGFDDVIQVNNHIR
jgi:hypothetical protein